jgi:hypothetical protein
MHWAIFTIHWSALRSVVEGAISVTGRDATGSLPAMKSRIQLQNEGSELGVVLGENNSVEC